MSFLCVAQFDQLQNLENVDVGVQSSQVRLVDQLACDANQHLQRTLLSVRRQARQDLSECDLLGGECITALQDSRHQLRTHIAEFGGVHEPQAAVSDDA